MTPLDRKLLREIWKLRGQMLSIAAVVAVGIMTVLTMRGTYDSLVLSRDKYYREARFPDVWASLERAPESVRRLIEALPGVAQVRTRVTFAATLDLASVPAPGLGRFVSIPDQRQSMLADLHLETGRYLAPGSRDEVIVSKKFALANRLGPGDPLRAVINGRLRELAIVGTAISPEDTYAVPPGALYPDDQRYGIVWMSRDALGPVKQLDGAFNEVLLALAPGANLPQVLAQLDRILEPYGGLGAYGRVHQPSHLILQSELDGNRAMGTAIPAVFLLVAAFLLNIVLGRMIGTQRTEIAVLKAFGYSNVEVGWHYLRFALVAVLGGAVVGILGGIGLGRSMLAMYGAFFDFPTLRYEIGWWLIVLSVGMSAVAASVGALGAVRRAVALPPAEAMRPEPPASFRPGFFERLGLGRLLPPAGRMILRNLERTPWRALFSAIGVAFSVAILVVGMFMFDGVQVMMNLQFRDAQREDLSLTFNRPLSPSAAHALAHLRGVTRVEPFRTVPARLRAGHRQRETAITAMVSDPRLRRVVGADGRQVPMPASGLLMSSMLAEQLDVDAGDTLAVEFLEGQRRVVEVTVAAVIDDFLGVSVHTGLAQLQRLVGGARAISGAYLAVEKSERSALNAQLKRIPVVASVASPQQMMASFDKQMAEGLLIGVFFLLGFSGVIAVAVIYNGARISLSERGRELASLRVFGFTRGEVALLLLGEQGLITLIGIPLGWGMGYALAGAVARGMRTETYRIPFIVNGSTFLLAGAITLLAAIASGWIVRRRLDRMSLIEVLKTRE